MDEKNTISPCTAGQQSDAQFVASLELDARSTVISFPSAANGKALLIPIGREQILCHFRHNPPTPDELEYAINAVEETLAPLSGTLPPSLQLATGDAWLF